MATIKDVAKLAGVSPATVSNILNQKIYVSSETYSKVTEAIKKLNYNPNIWASSLKSKKPKMIAVMIPEINTIYGQIITGIQQILEKHGYKCILKITDYNAYQEGIMLEDAVKNGVTGILIAPIEVENVEKYQSITDKGIPVVLLCNELKGIRLSSVVFDNKNIVYHLLDKILKNDDLTGKSISCVLVTGEQRFSENRDCKKGFEDALLKHDAVGTHFTVVSNKERAFTGLLEIVNHLEAVPDYFIVTEESYEKGLQWILQNNKNTRIFVLGGEISYSKWDGREEYISRNTIKLGETAANIILEYIKSPVYFDNKRILIPRTNNDYENLKWAPIEEKVHISLLGIKEVAGTQFFLRMLKIFENEYQIAVDCEFVEYSKLYRKLQEIQKGNNSEYDILMLDSQWFPLICNDDYFFDMTEFIEKDQDHYLEGFFPIAQKEFIYYNTKGIFTIPILVTMQFLFYRRDLFEDQDLQWHFLKKYGVELRPPRNWTEFDVIAQFFTREFNVDSPVQYGTEFITGDPINYSEQFFPRQWSTKGSIMSSKGEVVWDSMENYRALASLKKAYQCSKRENRRNQNEKNPSILDGDAAMSMTYATHIPNAFNEEERNVDFSDIVATTVPGKKPLFGGWSVAIDKSSRHPFEAYKFIKWISSNRNAIPNSLLGGFPPKNILLENSCVGNIYPWMKDIRRSFEYAQKRKILRTRKGKIIVPAVVDSLLAGSMHKLLEDECGIEEAIRNLQRDFEQLI